MSFWKNKSIGWKIGIVILIIVLVLAATTGLGSFEWMENLIDPNNLR